MIGRIPLILKGVAMGIAEAIPGVSGGTLAFITGIYEELISTIKSFTPANMLKIRKSFQSFWESINGPFLIFLLLGMVIGLGIGVTVISNLLVTQKEALWAFFFGIVLASVFYLSRDVRWYLLTILLGMAGAIISFTITHLTPATGTDHFLYIYMAGFIAVSALMLPGISGSFILLLLGLYELIIHSVKAVLIDLSFGSNLGVLAIFGLGVLSGMFSFARVLSYMLRRFYDGTMSFLIGILLGSLNKLWPWKLIQTALNTESGLIEDIGATAVPDAEMYKVISEVNISPGVFQAYKDPQMFLVSSTFILGCLIVLGLWYFGRPAK
jgi:putative membrane protein